MNSELSEKSDKLTVHFVYVDMEDLRTFAREKAAPEASDLTHWDINFWSERLREAKYDINEVECPSSLCFEVLI